MMLTQARRRSVRMAWRNLWPSLLICAVIAAFLAGTDIAGEAVIGWLWGQP